MAACLAGRAASTFEDTYHETLHDSAPRVAVNYATCVLCGGEMLRDSVSRVCSRELCKAVRIAKQKQLNTSRPSRELMRTNANEDICDFQIDF
jgi:hypothetical protein